MNGIEEYCTTKVLKYFDERELRIVGDWGWAEVE